MSRREYVTPTHDEQSLKAKPTRAPFGYYGAKQTIAQKIIKTLPPHNAWVEGFCGSAALTLCKQSVPIEVINDRDKQIVNLFSQLRDNAEALCRAVELTPYAREEFLLARDHVTKEELADIDPLEQARRFLVATMMTVNGTMDTRSGWSYSQSYARGGREARVNRWCNLPDRLEKVVERLRGIRVENRDARELVDMFGDRPATLMYLDPPYFTKRWHGYIIDAREEEFPSEAPEEVPQGPMHAADQWVPEQAIRRATYIQARMEKDEDRNYHTGHHRQGLFANRNPLDEPCLREREEVRETSPKAYPAREGGEKNQSIS